MNRECAGHVLWGVYPPSQFIERSYRRMGAEPQKIESKFHNTSNSHSHQPRLYDRYRYRNQSTSININNARHQEIIHQEIRKEALRRRQRNGITSRTIRPCPRRSPAMVPPRPRPSAQQRRRLRLANQRPRTSPPLPHYRQ